MNELTGDSTAQTSVVAQPQSTSPAEAVNPAQPQQSYVPQVSGNMTLADAIAKIAQQEAFIAQQDQRIRALMSEKDKAINSANKAITDYTNLHSEYSQYKEQMQSNISSVTTSAQTSIDKQKALETEIARLQGEAIRANALLQRPHLAPYAQFIPASDDPTKVKEALDQLESIRQQELSRSGISPLPQQQQDYGQPQGQPQGQQQPVQNPVEPNLLSLYSGRNIAPLAQMPGSTPAQMSPTGTSQSTPASIQQLFDEARASGDPKAFEQAKQQAILMANASINQQLGRSS